MTFTLFAVRNSLDIFGRFFGMNMKAGFHPEKNKEDAMIERIATLIEQGAL